MFSAKFQKDLGASLVGQQNLVPHSRQFVNISRTGKFLGATKRLPFAWTVEQFSQGSYVSVSTRHQNEVDYEVVIQHGGHWIIVVGTSLLKFCDKRVPKRRKALPIIDEPWIYVEIRILVPF